MAARAIWKGVITFEGVRLPVKLYSAVEDRSVHFRLLHDQDMVPIHQRMVYPDTEEEVPHDQQQKGVEAEPETFVVLSEEDLAAVEPEGSREIAVEQFVSPELINHQWYVRPYYLGPDGDVDEDYFALAAALDARGVEGVARWTMRRKDYVGALRAEGGYLMLVTLRHAGEVVSADQLEPPAGRDLDEREVKMARQLLSALEATFDATQFADQYRERVLTFVKQKAAGQTVEPEKPKTKQPATDSLAGMLEMSLAGVKGGG